MEYINCFHDHSILMELGDERHYSQIYGKSSMLASPLPFSSDLSNYGQTATNKITMWTFKIQAQFDRLNQHDVTNSKAIILKLRRRKRAHLSKIMIPKKR